MSNSSSLTIVFTFMIALYGGCDSQSDDNPGGDTLDSTEDSTELEIEVDLALDSDDLTDINADPGDSGDAGDLGDPGDPDGADPDTTQDTEVALDPEIEVDIPDAGDGVDDGTGEFVDWSESEPVTEEVYPGEPGPFTVVRSTGQIRDGLHVIELSMFIPAGSPEQSFPLVVFSHGFQLSADEYTPYGERLASHGIVAILPSYGDGILAPRSHTALANDVVDIIDWALEQSSQVDSALYGRVDRDRIGAGGHSRGGKQSILAAIYDPRIIATFDVDPVDVCHPFLGCSEDNPSVTPELMAGLNIPSGYIGAGLSSEAPAGQACAPEEENHFAYFEHSPTPSIDYLLARAGHLDFATSCGLICWTCTSGDDPDWNREFAVTTNVAFYMVYLAQDERYRPWVDGDAITALSDRVALSQR